MSETKFVKYLSFNGIFNLLLGLFILIAPKITPMSFGFTLCLAFIIYGGFKTITGFWSRNISRYYYLDILLGLITTFTGVLLFFAPMIDVMFIIALIGIFFILQSISTCSMTARIKAVFKAWRVNYITVILDLLFGIIVIISLSPSALWFAGVLFGIELLIKGISQINMSIVEE